jgi:hypothetical protein
MRTTLHTIATMACAFGLSLGTAHAADPAPKDKPSQQNRMKTCNADAKAKSLKGDERKTFMSACLKAK